MESKDLLLFNAVCNDGQQMVIASENENSALELARQHLDRWNIVILPATQEQTQLFQTQLKRNITIH